MQFNAQIHPNKIRQVLFLSLLILLTGIIIKEIWFLVPGILGAFTLYILLRRLMILLTTRWNFKNWVACIVLMLLSLVIIVLPFAWIISLLIKRLAPFLSNKAIIIKSIAEINNYMQQHFNIDFLNKQNLDKISNALTSLAPQILGSTLNMLANLLVLYFILYFLLTYRQKLENWIRQNIPLKPHNKFLLLKETKEIILSNAIGIPVVALFQGVLAIIGYYIFKVEEPIMWGIITGICSVIPVVGTMVAWVPLSMYEFAQGDSFSGIGLLLWGAIVIATFDNVLRLIFQKLLVDIHPIITIFGVVLGLNLLGFWGLVFGPLLLSLSLLLARIYINEYIDPDLEVKPVVDESKKET